MKRIVLSSLTAVMLATFSPAAFAADMPPPPQRYRALTVYGTDPCPKGEDGEIVVCAREPESERYRIPKRLRDRGEDLPEARSWSDRVQGVEEASRAQRPGSCTAVGSDGQTGCTQAMLRAWAEERRRIEAGEASVP